MSSVAVTIQEIFESGQSPSNICDLLKGRAKDLVSTRFSSVWKRQASPLPKVRSTSNHKVRTPERRSGKILEEACENWLLFLVWAMERCRLCLRMIWTCSPTRLTRLSYCPKPQRPRDCKEQSFFWRIWGMARNLRSCGQIRSYSLSRQFTIFKMTRFMQWIRVTSPSMTGWCFGDTNLLLLWSGRG